MSVDYNNVYFKRKQSAIFNDSYYHRLIFLNTIYLLKSSTSNTVAWTWFYAISKMTCMLESRLTRIWKENKRRRMCQFHLNGFRTFYQNSFIPFTLLDLSLVILAKLDLSDKKTFSYSFLIRAYILKITQNKLDLRRSIKGVIVQSNYFFKKSNAHFIPIFHRF
jgi:hypothetical protein